MWTKVGCWPITILAFSIDPDRAMWKQMLLVGYHSKVLDGTEQFVENMDTHIVNAKI